MPKIQEAYNYDSNYDIDTYTSEYIFVGSASSIKWIVYSSSAGNIGINWSLNGVDTVSTTSQPLVPFVASEISEPLNGKYVQFFVDSLVPSCVLMTQAFFFHLA